MKRSVHFLMTICLFLFVCSPITASAQTYAPSDTDVSIQVDDSYWYVFTRDNIENNPELEELGVSYEAIYDILYENHMYMDALLIYQDGDYVEFFVRRKELDTDLVNLSNYSDKDVQTFADTLAEKQGADEYAIYENQYKFCRSEYHDAELGFYVCEYITVVNKNSYAFTFQSPTQFDDAEYEEFKKIIDTVQFEIDPSLKEPKRSSGWEKVLVKAISGGIAGGAVGLIFSLINKRKKNNEINNV